MINKEIIAAAEAILFACGSPVEQDKLTEILNITASELDEVCALLRERYDREDSGISLVALENSYQLCTKPAFAEQVRKALQMRKVPPLSKASLEVLAITAYNQPVTRSFIEMVRGVDSSYIINSLIDKGLIAECGTLDAPGRPTLFATTDNFLRCFGLESLSDLPEALPVQMTEQDDNQLSLNIEELESKEAADSLSEEDTGNNNIN
jgi:segregation and condensation protein B